MGEDNEREKLTIEDLLRADDKKRVLEEFRSDMPFIKSCIVIYELQRDGKDRDFKWLNTDMMLDHFVYLIECVKFAMMSGTYHDLEYKNGEGN